MAPTASVFESLSEDECATGFVSGVLNIAIDDITTEMDYVSDEEFIMSPELFRIPMKQVCDAVQVLSVDNLITNPSPIAEESDDNEECYAALAQISIEEGNTLSFDTDDLESCDFDDEVCSMASENPDGLEDVDDMLMAAKISEDAVSDDMIRGAFTLEDFGKESEEEDCSDEELMFHYASGVLDDARQGSFFEELAEDREPKTYAPRLQQKQQQYLICLENALSAHVTEDPEPKTYAPRLQQNQQQYLTCLENALSAHVIEDPKTKAYAPRLQQKQQQYLTRLENALSAHVIEDEEQYHVEFVDEPSFCGEGLAFDLASTILDGAIVQAATTCKEREEEQLSIPVSCEHIVRNQLHLEGIKERAKQALLKAAMGRGYSATPVTETQDVASIESLKQMARGCLSKAAQASASSQLQAALRQVTGTDQVATENEPPVETVQPAVEMMTTCTSRNLHSSRSRRRVIGGVVRAPAVQHDICVTSASPRKQHSKVEQKVACQGSTSFCMDMGVQGVSEDDNDTMPGRSSSLTRSYDTLGVQFYSLADADELPYAAQAFPSSGSARKPSKARAKLHAASKSAMSMDLAEGISSAGGVSCASSTTASMHSIDQFTSSTSRGSFTPVPLSVGHKMRPSSSVGSLNLDQKRAFSSVKVKQAPGGLLPSLLPEKKSPESIAWSMNVSKTYSQWQNTGLCGSASMIF